MSHLLLALALAQAPPLGESERRAAEAWIGRLADDDPGVRENAAAALTAMGPRAVPFLEERAGREPVAEVRARIADAVSRIKPLEVVGVALKTRIKVGEPLPVEFRLKNVSLRAVPVLPTLDASDVGWRFPKCRLEIRDGKGELQEVRIKRCGNSNVLAATDFVELKPGETLPPFRHFMLGWRPQVAGTYTVKFLYDISAADPAAWRSTDGPPEPGALKLIEAMPRGRFESQALAIVVEE